MEGLIFIAGIFALFWFRNAIKGSAEMLTTVVIETNRQVEDSIKTYGDDIAIMNANKRNDQKKNINKIKNIQRFQTRNNILINN